MTQPLPQHASNGIFPKLHLEKNTIDMEKPTAEKQASSVYSFPKRILNEFLLFMHLSFGSIHLRLVYQQHACLLLSMLIFPPKAMILSFSASMTQICHHSIARMLVLYHIWWLKLMFLILLISRRICSSKVKDWVHLLSCIKLTPLSHPLQTLLFPLLQM